MRLGSVRMLVQALSWRREFKTAGERERESERERTSLRSRLTSKAWEETQ
jgi:hypothetical protein